MPKWVTQVLLGFIGLTVVLSVILAIAPDLADGMVKYIQFCKATGASCISNRQPGDQPGLC